MSIGYIPKKRAKARKVRRLRKKYKNFSCLTCAKNHLGEGFCKKKYIPTPPIGILICNYENCDEWKADPNYNRAEAEMLRDKVLKRKKHWLNKPTLVLVWVCFLSNYGEIIIWKII